VRAAALSPVATTLVLGLGVLAASVLAALAPASPRRAGSDNVEVVGLIAKPPTSGWSRCQAGEILPHDAAALRISLASTRGPAVGVAALADGRRVASGRRAPGWSGSSVVVPLAARPHRDVPARVCVTVGASRRHVGVLGTPASPPAPARMRIDYLRAGRESWWSLLPTIGARLGRGHAWSGPSVAIVTALLIVAVIALALRVAHAEARDDR
jgi:hypothetical protein